MKKKLLSLVCALALTISLLPAAQALEGEGTRAAEALASLGLVTGTGAGYTAEDAATQEQAAARVGKSRPAITNALRLLNLPEDMQNMLERGEMTAGHARTLLSFKNEDQMKAAARRVTMEGISVRELEKMAKRANEEKPEKADKPAKRRIRYYDEAELALRDVLNRVVHISGTKKKAALTIEFYGEEDLKNLLYDLKLTDKTDE